MEFAYGGKNYELYELKTPNKLETSDIIGIFETKGQETEDLVFINYFYGATVMSDEEMKEVAIGYIDDYQKQNGGITMNQKEIELVYMPESIVNEAKIEGMDVYIADGKYYCPVEYISLPSPDGEIDSYHCVVADSLEALIQDMKEAFDTDITKKQDK